MKRIIAGAISVLILSVGIPAATKGRTEPRSQTKPTAADKIKHDVESLGRASRVTVVLRNGNEYYGAIGDATEESFELLEIDLNQKITIAYSDVSKVRSGFGNPNPYNGKRWRPAWHIAAIAIAVGLTVVLVAVGASASR
jgi:hypothetical protein